MKSKHTLEDIAQAHIIPAKLSAKEKREEDLAFSNFIANRRANMTDEERLLSSLLQLKYQMESFIDSNEYDNTHSFGYFLNAYIHILNLQQQQLSKAIDIHQTKLSRLIKGSEEPNEKLFVRLEVHSRYSIPAINWYRIAEKSREHRFITNKTLRQTEKKFVKQKAKINSLAK